MNEAYGLRELCLLLSITHVAREARFPPQTRSAGGFFHQEWSSYLSFIENG